MVSSSVYQAALESGSLTLSTTTSRPVIAAVRGRDRVPHGDRDRTPPRRRVARGAVPQPVPAPTPVTPLSEHTLRRHCGRSPPMPHPAWMLGQRVLSAGRVVAGSGDVGGEFPAAAGAGRVWVSHEPAPPSNVASECLVV